MHAAQPASVPVAVFGRPSPIALLLVALRKVEVLLHQYSLGSAVDVPVVSPATTVIPLPQPTGAASKYLQVVLQSDPVEVKFEAT